MNEQTLTRYLLGELPEAEQAKIEERIFTDDEFFQQVCALKAELTDRYVRGDLAAAERTNYEARFMTLPVGLQDAAFAKALTQVLAAEPVIERAVVVDVKPTLWEALAAFFRGSAFGFGVAMASLLLLAVGGYWWYRNAQHRQIEAQQAKIARDDKIDDALRDKIGEAKADQAEAKKVLEKEVGKSTQAQKKEATPKISLPKAESPSTLLSVLLVPSLVRGDSQRTRIAIPASTGRIQLQLDLDQSDKYLNYQAELRTKRGQLLQRQSKLVPRPTAAGKAVFFVAPATGLRNSDYDITLFGVTSSGTVEEANFYQFTAVRR